MTKKEREFREKLGKRFGQRLRQALEEKFGELTTIEYAERLNVSENTARDWLAGSRLPSVPVLVASVELLGESLDGLLMDDDK